MRVLITGAGGFVGPHLVTSLRATAPDQIDVVPTSLSPRRDKVLGNVPALDVTDKTAVRDAIAHWRPSHVVHLAGIAAPPIANQDPQASWRVHVHGTLNVAHAIQEIVPDCVFVFVGSGLIYGSSANSAQPLNEQALLAPMDDYAVTKAAADLALGALAKRGLRCIRLRPFNHTGAGQSETFVVPAFARQLARIAAGLEEPIIRVGNLDVWRDFLDVRDLVAGYALSVYHAGDLPSGLILNLASGTAYRLGDILNQLIELSGLKVTVVQDPARLRTIEIPRLVGDAGLARRLLGWVPKYNIEETLAAVLGYWREEVKRTTI